MSSLSPSLVQIPNVSAVQLVGSERIPLKSGTLTLALPFPGSPGIKLLLNIDTLTIPLSGDSIVGTKDSLTYLFTFPLSATEIGFVEVTLPPSADDETTEVSKAATKFEGVLVGYGFLNAGLVADADDMARAVKEAAGRAADKLTAETNVRVQGTNGVEEGGEASFSNTTHKVANSTAEGSGKLAKLSGRISSAVSGATFEAGRWVGDKLGDGPAEPNSEEAEDKSLPREAVDQVLEAAGAAALGVGQSVAHVSSTVGKCVAKVAEHEQGHEAKELVEGARKTTGDAGQVVVDTTQATSVVWQAGEAGVGAASAGQMDD